MKTMIVQQIESSGDEILRQKFGTPDVPVQTTISASVARYLESFDFFFIATSNRKGECDASLRGKRDGPTSLKVLGNSTIVFPDYLGNGSFRSLGNILENPHIGVAFVNFDTGSRIRVNGDAEVVQDPNFMKIFPGCIQIVKVTVREVYKQNRPVSINQFWHDQKDHNPK